jgi:hypothetical protein
MQIDDPFLSIYEDLTREIISWLCDCERKSNVYLIPEPQLALSIPARISVLASICYNADRFGAQSYGSNVGGIICQLAARYRPYRHIHAGILVDNPRILELPTHTCFKKLIHEPWKTLQESHPQYIAAPPAIVISCPPDYDNEELLYTICEFASSQCTSSLLWIISIDRNTKLPIRDLLHPFVPWGYTPVPVCYDKGPSDAALILRHEFRALCDRNYQEISDRDEKWPSDEQMSHLIRIVSGVLGSIEAIIDFVDRADGGGPEAHLETFLSYMVDSPSPSNERPYCALDHFYIHAFSNIRPHLLSVVNQVLSIIHYSAYSLDVTPLQIACLLSIGTDTILSIYPYLSGFAISIDGTLFLAHVLFGHFLNDPKRSRQAAWHYRKSRPAVLETFLHFLSYSSNLLEFLKSRARMITVTPNAYIELEGLRSMISRKFCDPIKAFHSACLERVLILRFDFRCLAHTSDATHAWYFMPFLCALCDVSALIESMMQRTE